MPTPLSLTVIVRPRVEQIEGAAPEYLGLDFVAGPVTVFIADHDIREEPEPVVFFDRTVREGLPISAIEPLLAALHCILDDPRFQAARAAKAASVTGLPTLVPACPRQPEPRPLIPPPAGFRERTLLGHIAGAPAWGCQEWDDVAGEAAGRMVVVELNGLELTFLGDDQISLGTSGSACGDMTVAEWGRVRELAQTNIVEQLIKLGRAWCAEGAHQVAVAAD